MKGKKSWVLVAFVMSCLALLSATSAFAEGRGVTKDAIQVGMILVKTGPVAALGLPEGWGVQDTFNEVNGSGGINGRKINFIWEDDQFKTPLAISAFNKLIFRDKVLSIVTGGERLRLLPCST
jgi:branched-chain amino acid transport system substrate-binding protein